MLKGRFTNPVSDGISGFVSKGIRYLEKEIYYFPFNIAPSSEYFIKADGSAKLRTEYPLIEKDYSSPDPSSLAKDNFPLMTSNTAPAPYIAKASSVSSASAGAFHAFNKNNNNWYNTWFTNTGFPQWVELQTGAKWLLIRYTIQLVDQAPRNWSIVGYQDANYTSPQILDERIEDLVKYQTKTFTLTNPLAFNPVQVFRMIINTSNETRSGVGELIFYTITEEQYNTIKNSFVLPNLINYEDSTQGYICLREHVTTYK